MTYKLNVLFFLVCKAFPLIEQQFVLQSCSSQGNWRQEVALLTYTHSHFRIIGPSLLVTQSPTCLQLYKDSILFSPLLYHSLFSMLDNPMHLTLGVIPPVPYYKNSL